MPWTGLDKAGRNKVKEKWMGGNGDGGKFKIINNLEEEK